MSCVIRIMLFQMNVMLTYVSVMLMPLHANIFPNKLRCNVPNKILGNSSHCSFVSFSIAWVTPFLNKPECLRDFTIFMMSFVSLFDIISVVVPNPKVSEVPDPNTFSWIYASAADTVAVNPNGINRLLANSVSTFFIKRRTFLNGLRSLSRNTPNCIMLDSCVFDNCTLTNDLFAKAL